MAKKKVRTVKKRKGYFDNIDLKLKWGYKGLQISFILLLVIIVVLFVIAVITSQSFSELNNMIFKAPQGVDYLGIFAGAILFIAVPFLIGIKIGMGVKKR